MTLGNVPNVPDRPEIGYRAQNALIAHDEDVVIPATATEKIHYEGELAVVIGRGGRHIPELRWREHVFGYTVINDVSARDFQMATSQWMMGKTFDTFCPMGPALVTADEIEDPHTLRISLAIRGEVLQDSNTSNLIFGIPRLIAYLSSVFTLEPGDIISTGTPSGVGLGQSPPRYLADGDVVELGIDGLGSARQRLRAYRAGG